jgi:catechol 2,3-dioxygenase-like lactoylglutathione lyase family enzyme
MSSTDVSQGVSSETPAAQAQEMKLEVVVVPVSDVDRAKGFYEMLGWRLDADYVAGEDFRVVQMTPPGSSCSIIFGSGLATGTPGSADSLILVVYDVEIARAELLSHGVDVSEIFHDAGGVFHHSGTRAGVPGPEPAGRSYASWASFRDPDGNGWLLQEIKTRLPGR